MFSCPKCGSLAKRRRRSGLEKLLCTGCFVCSFCGEDVKKYRGIFQFLQSYVDCPRCGTADLGKTRSRDRIDGITKNPLRRFLGMFGAPLYHCHYCRFQFYDTRPRHDKPIRPSMSGGGDRNQTSV